MKHNYKIRVDDPLPSDEQIARHKNFDRLLADHHRLTQPIYRRPLYKNPRAFIGLVLILTIGFLVFQAVEEEKDKLAEQELPEAIRLAEENAFLQPVLPGLTVPYDSRTLPGEQATQVRFGDGTEVDVPAGAFVTADGDPVPNARVRLLLRRIHGPLEIAASGIPMVTMDGDQATQLESHLLFELRAEADGKPVALKEGRQLTVLLPPTQVPPARDLKLYRLDTVLRSWLSLEPDYEVLETPSSREMITSMDIFDGMEMVEFDEDGRPVKVERPKIAGDTVAAVVYRCRVQVESLGMLSLDRRLDEQHLQVTKIRLADDAGRPVQTYALYKIIDGLNTVAYFWPRDKEFTFELSFLPGREQTLFGFREDGRLVRVRGLRDLQAGSEVQTLPVTVSEAPVENFDQLKQLLLPGQGQ